MRQIDLEILAKTLYGEASANNVKDAEAIASVILNRVKLKNWPNQIDAVCLQPWQFSCWNKEYRSRIDNAKGKWYQQCIEIARRAISGEIADPTWRSTHYYATYIGVPKWAFGKKPVYSVEHKSGSKHLFFNDIDTPKPIFIEPKKPTAWERFLNWLDKLGEKT